MGGGGGHDEVCVGSMWTLGRSDWNEQGESARGATWRLRDIEGAKIKISTELSPWQATMLLSS